MLRKAVLLLCLVPAAVAFSQVTTHTFEGIDASNDINGGQTVDPNGAVGTKQYLEWVDAAYQGYNKTTGAAVYPSAKAGDTPWSENNMTNCEGPSGNGVILFDHLASRWVVGVRQNATNYYCLAVSNTDDLTASSFAWHAYELSLAPLMGTNKQGHTYYPDYPRLGTWSDAYYISIDLEDPDQSYTEVGVLVCAFDRTNILTGGVARTPQCFRYPDPPTGLFLMHTLVPADIEGLTAPPTGQPESFVSIVNPHGSSTQSNQLAMWTFHVNWTTPSESTFTGPAKFAVAAYTPGCYSASNPTFTECVPEPSSSSTKNDIDSIGDRLMHRFAYRHFAGDSQSYLISHTVQVGSGNFAQTGVRWYELGGTGNLVTSGTISLSDSNYRFVPSIAQDQTGNMAVGYSVSGTATHPSIRASYLNLPHKSSPTEIKLLTGTADEENSYHWGGYTSMTVDPVDDCTFWYVNEYYSTNQTGVAVTWRTRISNFKIPTCQ
jgi:hypothetical protein